ncbi:MAG: hypothetical protein IJK23_12625 [Clostridia bacterium]|nr:hypothetical protein [Clostridia bacterium]
MIAANTMYPLIPSQQTMCYMLKYSLHKQVTNVPVSLATSRKLDFGLLAKALNIEITRNDCLRLRFAKQGGKMMQYFLDKNPIEKVRVLHFPSVQAQEEFFEADAAKAIRPLKETFRVYFFTDSENRYGVYLNACHLIMDAFAASVFFRDLFAVYDALVSGGEMPAPLARFEEHLPKEYEYLESEQYKKDREYFDAFHRGMGCPPFYAGVHGPAMLEKQRRRKPDLTVPVAFDPIHDKAESAHLCTDEETTKLILGWCEKNKVAPEILMQTGYKIHAAALNYHTDDTMMMTLCSRRITAKEKNMGGCMAQVLQMRTKLPTSLTFEETVKRVSAQRSSHFRHMNFPYIDALEMERKIYHFSQAQGPALMMYTWLPLDALAKEFGADDPEFRFYNPGRYIMPLYTFTFRSLDGKRLECLYMYRTNLICRADIEALHEGCFRILRYALAHPETTIDELFNIR